MSCHIHSVSNQVTKVLCLFLSVLLIHSSIAEPSEFKRTYPKQFWQTKKPSEADLNSEKIDTIACLLEGRGCIVRHGFVVKSWGNQSEKGDWMSSSKPVFSTLLFLPFRKAS